MIDIITDLALEKKEVFEENGNSADGYTSEDIRIGDITVNRVRVFNKKGAEVLNREIGNYATIELNDYALSDRLFESAVDIIGHEISLLADFKKGDTVLAVGLGNDGITADSLGPKTVEKIMVTRHLKENAPEFFFGNNLREVSAITPGVLGQTGIESFEIVKSIVQKTSPDVVIVIDSLASRRLTRLAKAVQISDRGLVPGGGVGNRRKEISERTLGIKCISVGVPTVVDAATLTGDIINDFIKSEKLENSRNGRDIARESFSGCEASLIVTPKDIEQIIRECARLLAYGINKAVHHDLSTEDISDFLKA